MFFRYPADCFLFFNPLRAQSFIYTCTAADFGVGHRGEFSESPVFFVGQLI